MDNAFSQEDGRLNYYEIARVLDDHNERCYFRTSVEDDIKAGCCICIAYFNFDRTTLAVEIYKDRKAHCALFTRRTIEELMSDDYWGKWFPDLTLVGEEKDIVLDALASLIESNGGDWEDVEEKLFARDSPLIALDNTLHFMATEGWYDELAIEELWQRAVKHEGTRILQQEVVFDHQNNKVYLHDPEGGKK